MAHPHLESCSKQKWTANAKLFKNPTGVSQLARLRVGVSTDPNIEKGRERIILKGDVPSPISPPSGCPFRTRCPAAMAICSEEKPNWKEVHNGHWVSCHLYND
ncbi:hypothetical protein F3157_02335 [Virgibacillus dakarensis]|uniref:Oligopeptide/dipeptide ABC transporter C-terminal domain-containing protein n=1 Tax=Lentibacillus populi TaxID=1827502 RepID=A0A9W5TXW8_9BACI|nr:hypothetical protein [Virgibacillus dakarensis]MTW84497.1 hypothetical protein [Virgibacillus dakarensis]GGB42314.1 hypothetical protein GCM10011409_19830 [Lentibacillus populi]